MRKKACIFILSFFVLTFSVLGQKKWAKSSIEGTITDSLNVLLINATAVVTLPNDTVMVAFGISDSKGSFNISRLDTGEYELTVNYLGFTPFREKVFLNGTTKKMNIGQITLRESNVLLDGVEVVAQYVPIQINKDTISYNAQAFKVEVNADVEALLKKLPGIEVDEDGKIKAQGEEIFKILVDGEEFFGSDPKIATKNLPADAVARIQVFEKKSDQAKFTGIDDGNEQKTINIQLKKDRQSGYFGKITAGYGSHDRYNLQASVNRFSKKTKFSVLGRLNNTNEQGFSSNRINQFDRSGSGGNNPSGNAGFNATASGGINLNHRFSKKVKIRGNYFLNNSKNETEGGKRTLNILPYRVFYENQSYSNLEDGGDNRLNFTVDFDIDSTQKIQVKASGNIAEHHSQYLIDTRTTDSLEVVQSDINTNRNMQREQDRWSSTISYQKKLNKTGRNFSTSYSVNNNQSNRNRFMLSDNIFFSGSGVIDIDTIRQLQDMNNGAFQWNINSTYTEPIGEKKYVTFSYRHSNVANSNERDVFQLVSKENFDVEYQIDSLSSEYERSYSYDRAKLVYRSNQEKINFSAGLSAQRSVQAGRISGESLQIKNTFLNLLPELNVRLNLAQSKNFRLGYRTSVREPTLRQLQPILENQNPLNIYIGNPELIPSYQHRLTLSYNSFHQASLSSFFVSINSNLVQNTIINARTIDDLNRSITQPINSAEQKSLGASANFSRPLPFFDWKMSLNSNGRWSTSPAFINRVLDKRIGLNGQLGINIRSDKNDHFQYGFGWRRSTNVSLFQENKNSKRLFYSDVINGNLLLKFLKKWYLSTSLNYTIYGGNAFVDKQRVPLLMASLSTSLLPKDKLQIKLSAFDLLNQNQGLQRSSTLTTIEERTVQSLARFFMLSAVYSIQAN